MSIKIIDYLNEQKGQYSPTPGRMSHRSRSRNCEHCIEAFQWVS